MTTKFRIHTSVVFPNGISLHWSIDKILIIKIRKGKMYFMITFIYNFLEPYCSNVNK